jgi:hypothetical protein
MSNQYCHFSCHPTPSKLTMMNCGGFSPALSLRGTKPSACPPALGFVAVVDPGEVLTPVVLADDGDPVEDGVEVEPVEEAVGSSGTGTPGFGGTTVTLLVTVTGAESWTDPLHADSRHAEMVMAAVASRVRVLIDRRLTNPPLGSLHSQQRLPELTRIPAVSQIKLTGSVNLPGTVEAEPPAGTGRRSVSTG